MKRLFLIIVGIILFGIVLSYLTDPPSAPKSKPAPVISQPLDIQFPKDSSSIVKEHVQKADESKAAKLKGMFVHKSDEFSGRTVVRHKNAPAYVNRNGIFLYFTQTATGAGGLRFAIQYYADEWLFVESYDFVIDGERYSYRPVEFETDHDSDIWEWSDEPIRTANRKVVAALRSAKKAKIRFNGRQYYDDKVITESQLKAIRETLDYYEALGGTW